VRSIALAALIAEVDGGRPRDTNLSSALRLFVLDAIKKERPDSAAGAAE
jgi:predicted DNA-binding ribbon-helix-helix protein